MKSLLLAVFLASAVSGFVPKPSGGWIIRQHSLRYVLARRTCVSFSVLVHLLNNLFLLSVSGILRRWRQIMIAR
jgi:hypothetical protein